IPERALDIASLFGVVAAAPAGIPLAALVRADIAGEDAKTTKMESRASGNSLRDATVQVPAKAVGWARLKWEKRQVGRQKMNAELWAHHGEYGPRVSLLAHVEYRAPFISVASLQDVHLPDVAIDRLPVHNAVYVWSLTRSSLDLKAVNVPLYSPS